MPEKKPLVVVWSDQALQNSISIKDYLLKNFSEKELVSFYSLLYAFEEAVAIFPELYPVTKKKRSIRRAIISKVTSVFYRVFKNKIEVLAILNNRSDISKYLK